MIKDGQLVCDSCGAAITRISSTPEEGWEKMHNLCSNCFETRSKSAVARG
jgi:hypothetical protein